MASIKPPKSAVKKCPNCQNFTVPKYRPFCSSRCAHIDLSKWFNESYRVSAVEIDDFDEDEFSDEEG